MRYSLRRTRDGAGDAGSMSEALIPWFDDNNILIRVDREENGRPKVGAAMRVGSHFAGTYSSQDYWTTTPITEILEDRPDYVKFKTGNSIYEWTTS